MMRHARRLAFALLALSALPVALAAPSRADDDGRRGGRHGQYANPGRPDYGEHDRRNYRRPGWHRHRRGGYRQPYRQFRGHDYGPIIILPPYNRRHRGYGYYRSDAEAYPWLGFAAVGPALLNGLSETQQRAHESAQVRATTAGVGESVAWSQGGAGGAVAVLRDGRDADGRYCREFQQRVSVGDRSEAAYGTACRQPDGAWEIVAAAD